MQSILSKKNIQLLKNLIEKFNLFINNKLGYIIILIYTEIFIIDLILLIVELCFLTLEKIPKKYILLLEYELILFQEDNISHNLPEKEIAKLIK